MSPANERAFETHVEEILLGPSGWKRGVIAELFGREFVLIERR